MEMGMDGGYFDPLEDVAEEFDSVINKGDALKIDLRKHENSPLAQSILGMIEHQLGVNSIGRRRFPGVDVEENKYFSDDQTDPRLRMLKERVNNFSLLDSPVNLNLSFSPSPEDHLDLYYDGIRQQPGKDYLLDGSLLFNFEND